MSKSNERHLENKMRSRKGDSGRCRFEQMSDKRAQKLHWYFLWKKKLRYHLYIALRNQRRIGPWSPRVRIWSDYLCDRHNSFDFRQGPRDLLLFLYIIYVTSTHEIIADKFCFLFIVLRGDIKKGAVQKRDNKIFNISNLFVIYILYAFHTFL